MKHTANFVVRFVRMMLLLGFVLGVSNPSIAAKVKKKTGEVVEGDIKGTVVLWEHVSDGNPTAFAVEGKHVRAIDENGLRAVSGKCLVVFGKEVTNPAEVLLMVQRLKDRKMGPLEMFTIELPSGGLVIVLHKPGDDPITAKLLGELRMEKMSQPGENKSPTIVPALEIRTEKGTVSVPVGDIVESSQQKK